MEWRDIEAVASAPADRPRPRRSRRILFYLGLVTMLVAGAVAAVSVSVAVFWSNVYTLDCTAIPPPLTAPPSCTRDAALASDGATLAVLGGVLGLVGLGVTLLGAKGSRSGRAHPARRWRF